MKRNTIVLGITVLFILAVFAWAGWANFEYRKQAAERRWRCRRASRTRRRRPSLARLQYLSPLLGKPAPRFHARRPERQKSLAGQL